VRRSWRGLSAVAIIALAGGNLSECQGCAEAPTARSDTQEDIMEKPVATRERATLLTIIAALAKAANIDIWPGGEADFSGHCRRPDLDSTHSLVKARDWSQKDAVNAGLIVGLKVGVNLIG
jgi:hypothetical protein